MKSCVRRSNVWHVRGKYELFFGQFTFTFSLFSFPSVLIVFRCYTCVVCFGFPQLTIGFFFFCFCFEYVITSWLESSTCGQEMWDKKSKALRISIQLKWLLNSPIVHSIAHASFCSRLVVVRYMTKAQRICEPRSALEAPKANFTVDRLRIILRCAKVIAACISVTAGLSVAAISVEVDVTGRH